MVVVAGRNSRDGPEDNHQVVAEEGQQIPVNPPGQTCVYHLDSNFEVVSQELR
jgi:hypothetical protein